MILNKLIGSLTLKNKSHNQNFDREIKTSKYIPISHFVTKEIFSTKNGELGAVIKVMGTPFDVKDGDELNNLQFLLSFAIQHLGDSFAVYVTAHRHQQSSQLSGEYPQGFSSEFHAAYSQQFHQANLYVNDIYITLIQQASSQGMARGLSFIRKLNESKSRQDQAHTNELRLRQFQIALTNFKANLSPYSPKVLGAKMIDGLAPQAEVLRFLSILVNGRDQSMTYPYQDIASFVSQKRPYFGNDTLHLQGLHKGDDCFGAMLSIKTYSPISLPGMLNALLNVPFETIATHSFSSINKNTALKLIEKQIRRLTATDDAAKSQIDDLETAKDDLASDRIGYGYHHNTLLVLSDKMNDLEDKVAAISKIYQDQQLMIVRESLNLESAFWAQIPGNFKNIRRSAPISTNNFSCFCSLHNYYSGYIDANHLGSALMLIETPSKTPHYLNLHEVASGRKDDLSKGHTLLIGPSNAGKTVIMMAVDAMFQKHGIRSFIFDRKLGCEIYVRAMGGLYNRLVPGEPTGWNPCQTKDTTNNRKFLRDFMAVLSSSRTEELTAKDYKQIAEVVDRNFSLTFEKRNLSNISSFFSLDFAGLDALSRYLRLPDRSGKAGDRAYLFDNDTDEMNFNADIMGFDLTHWLNDTGIAADELLPLSMYLFHRMEECFDKRLTGIYLDEGWQFLQQPYWKEKIQEYLVTLRKSNVFIFLATQLPNKLAESSLSSALIEGTATHIFLANPKASEKDYINAFKLSPREFDIVRNANMQSRYFLIKQGQEAAVGRINLNGLENYLAVLSGNQNSVKLCEEIRQEVGEDPATWLPVFEERRLK